jgi:voltage-gated potassium channel
MTDKIRQLFLTLHKERFFKIFGVMFLILLISSGGIYFFEHRTSTTDVKDILDAFWWSLVTITTVGYGDTVPRTTMGRVIAMVTMITGIFLLSIITATIASVFVGKKIKEDKGLESIKTKGHVVLCGWNEWADEVIEAIISDTSSRKPKLSLINELPLEEVDAIRERYGVDDIEYVRGDFVFENVLKRANIQHAEAVIVLADRSGGRSLDRADERTILATLAIKGIAPKAMTCAELLDSNNRQHLVRAKVDEIIVRGEKTGTLLAFSVLSPGLPRVFDRLISADSENRLWKVKIPGRFIGKPISELSAHLSENSQATLIGILTEEKGMKLDDILSHDLTAIDEFIKRKFEESQMDFFAEGGGGHRVTLNPEANYLIGQRDYAVAIAKKRP